MMTETKTSRWSRIRWIAMALAPVLALLAGGGGVLGMVGSTSAAAAPTGFYYAAGIFPTKNQNLSIGSLTHITVQHDEAAVAKTMSPDQLSAATIALGGTPKAGFEVTKKFDNTDKALSIASLAGSTLYSAGLWTYYNGKVCAHERGQPVYVAFVDQTPPPAGSTAALTETIEFVATNLTPVITNTCPSAIPKPTTGVTYSGSATVNGTAYSLADILEVSFLADPVKLSATITADQQSQFKQIYGGFATQEIAITKGLDSSDKALVWLADSVVKGQVVIKVTDPKGGLTRTFTATDPMVLSLTWSGAAAGPVETVKIAFTNIKIS
jgi:hypothetical protein